MLSVRMLGVLTISVDGQRIPDDLGPTARILSGFLFEFMGRVHRRERLADKFWGHLDPDRARAALNTALWRFRKLLAREPRSEGGRNLRSNGSEVILEPASWLDIDSFRFGVTVKRLLEQHEQANTQAYLSELETAIGSYAGPFLDGDDADWILEEREWLRSLYVRAANELVKQYGQAERYEEAIAVTRRILSADPFRESVHRDLLVLLLLNGQRAEALHQHDHWSALLRQELDVDPMPQTLRLAEELRSGQIFERLEVLKAQHFENAKAKPYCIPDDTVAPHFPTISNHSADERSPLSRASKPAQSKDLTPPPRLNTSAPSRSGISRKRFGPTPGKSADDAAANVKNGG
jgi:DNA-binding SARP family transcriptional activator